MRTCALSILQVSTSCEHIAEDYVSAAFTPASVCRICGSGKAETFNESDWQTFTEEIIEENHYEEIPEDDFADYVTDAADEGDLFPIETWDEGNYGDDGWTEDDGYYDEIIWLDDEDEFFE